jgi:HK97 gp10 family phage protein
VRLSFSFDQRSSQVANLRGFDSELQLGVRQLNGQYAEWTRALAEQLAPKDTGFMAAHIRKDFSPDLLRWSVGYQASDFLDRGFAPYFLYQELGTLYQEPQPHLGPAFHEMEPYYLRDLAELIRSSINRHNVR